MPHTCNYYCHDTVHAWTVLVPPGCPEAERATRFAAILRELGYTLQAFRPAPETDVAAIMQTATQVAYVTRAGVVSVRSAEGLVTERPKVPYLALVETAPGGEIHYG